MAGDARRIAQDALQAFGDPLIGMAAQPRSEPGDEVGVLPGRRLRCMRRDPPPATAAPHDRALGPRRAVVDEQGHLGRSRLG